MSRSAAHREKVCDPPDCLPGCIWGVCRCADWFFEWKYIQSLAGDKDSGFDEYDGCKFFPCPKDRIDWIGMMTQAK
jgi:hypothetical protein